MTLYRGNGRLPSSEDDEENEEIMRANANINNMQQTSNSNGNGNGNNAQKPSGSNPTKSAADNWKGIGNRHMASQVSAKLREVV